MSKKLYVGNLNYQTNEDLLREAFSAYGQVERVNVITDRETGRPRGFAFVEMGSADQAQAAIDALDGRELDGRNLTVNVARERPPRSGGGGFGGGGGGGGGHRGGGGGHRSSGGGGGRW